MTYLKKYAKYIVLADGMNYKWFKNIENALAWWNESVVANDEMIEEWLDEYDSVKLIDAKTKEVIKEI